MKMIKVRTADLIGAQLDWAVAKTAGKLGSDDDDEAVPGMLYWCPGNNLEKVAGPSQINPNTGRHFGFFMPSRNWAHGGPIIERESIGTERTDRGDCWGAWIFNCAQDGELPEAKGPTPLIAAMRAFVASNLGGEVEVPEVTA